MTTTTITPGPGILYSILTAVKDDLVDAFQQSGSSFARNVIMPAAIAWDECDQCGLLAFAQTRVYLSDSFPSEAAMANIENASLLVGDFMVQAIRCAPMPDESGNPPSVRALESSAATISSDQVLTICTVLSTLQTLANDYSGYVIDYVIRQSLMAGPEGGCVGSELGFSVAVSR